MGYTYDSGSKDIREGGNKVGWAMVSVVAAGLIALLTALLTASPENLLTTFSSIPEPPPGIEYWYKGVLRDGWPVDEWWETVVVTDSTTIQIGDVITSTGAFTLTETWDTDVLTLTGYISTTGTVISSTGSLVWSVDSGLGHLVKSWEVLTNTWSTSAITEVLQTSGGVQTATVSLELGEPPATPTPTPTVYASPTPRYTPRPWPTVSYPTATPCVGMGCAPIDDQPVAYMIYVPLVMLDYDPFEPWFLPPVLP